MPVSAVSSQISHQATTVPVRDSFADSSAPPPSPEESRPGKSADTGVPDRVDISNTGRILSARQSTAANGSEGLTEQDLVQLRELKRRDTEVRSHEQAHLAAAGQYARGGASFTYRRGPDGASYAVAGEVPIDLSKEQTPSATIAKMQAVKRAALAPASPSAADRQIAAQASTKEAQARQELASQARSEPENGTEQPRAEQTSQLSRMLSAYRNIAETP